MSNTKKYILTIIFAILIFVLCVPSNVFATQYEGSVGDAFELGDNVKLYQGVTLGAKSFPLDEQGNPIKGIARHPILEDGVIVYANATILGRITIGKGCVVGANTWVMEDMAPETIKNNQYIYHKK